MQCLADVHLEVGPKDCTWHLVDHSDVTLRELGKLRVRQVQVVKVSTAHAFRVIKQGTED